MDEEEVDVGEASAYFSRLGSPPRDDTMESGASREEKRAKADEAGVDAGILPDANGDVDYDGFADTTDIGGEGAPLPEETAPGEPGTDEPNQDAPPVEDERKPLEVSASPFTPALPLDGEPATHLDALLPASTFPTLTITYRTRPGDS
jgi:hypothetical protein